MKLIVDGSKKARRLAREKKYDNTKKEQNDAATRARRYITATRDKLDEIPI